MSQHTPGPWTVEDPMGDIELSIVEAGKETYEWRFIAHITLPTKEDPGDFSKGEAEANARLIAAAPELLAACQKAAEGLTRNWGDDWGEDFEPIRAAIAKTKQTPPPK